MTKLGPHIHNDGDHWINLTTKQQLPLHPTDKEIRDTNSAPDQWLNAIHQTLDQPSGAMFRTLITTWHCNLRCTHCFIAPKLHHEPENPYDPEDLYQHIINTKEEQHQRLHLVHIGGESGLYPTRALNNHKAAIKAAKHLNMRTTTTTTTNLTQPLTQETIELYQQLDVILISIDGNQEEHDQQRKNINKHDPSPYQKTIHNLDQLIAHGLANKIKIQATRHPTQHTPDQIIEWATPLLALGLKPEQLNHGTYQPNQQNPQHDAHPFPIPCCTWRGPHHLTIEPNGNITTNYFTNTSTIGTLKSTKQQLQQAYHHHRNQNMPILNDPGCNNCPVIGICWGKCTANQHQHPSQHCQKDTLQQQITDRKGQIHNWLNQKEKTT